MSEMTTAASAIQELTGAYFCDEPVGEVAGPVIGYVGQDVPVELIAAAGAVPLRLRGSATWTTDIPNHYLGTGVDPAISSILTGILERRFGLLAGIVVSSDCDASQRLFYVLREILRVEPNAKIPPVHLLDILHLPRETTTRYNITRLTQFIVQLQKWTDTPVLQESIAAAVGEQDCIRALQRGVMGLRRTVPARIAGTEALAIIGAGTRMAGSRYMGLLKNVLDGANELPIHEGRRVFLTGSSHDSAGVYSEIEARGAVIVGEDHDWGDLCIESDVGSSSVEALARRYQTNGPTSQRASIQERAAYTAMATGRAKAQLLLSYSRQKDDAPLWDYSAQVAAAGIAAASIHRQAYDRIDVGALTSALSLPEEQALAS